ncbi:MAG TPA: phytanoyl-CoA dioxygenase family protein [Solirubrobacteraceae bacterium]|nr:phytanoyl-CoA dioxygenase family protein [Solirubrobacteraceae bacterium]
MGLLRGVMRRERHHEPAAPEGPTVEPFDVLSEEIAKLTAENRRARDRAVERRLVALRHDAGIAATREASGSGGLAAPDAEGLRTEQPISEVAPESLTPGNLRAGILRSGCVLVRQLIPAAEATAFADQIQRGWEARERLRLEGTDPDGYYEEWDPKVGTGVIGRPWLEKGGNFLAGDSPRMLFEMLELFERANLLPVVAGYLGERPLISLHKSTLRRADPRVAGRWHQDGKFMHVRALNLWMALSSCGADAPGLDIYPGRLEDFLPTGTDDAPNDWTIAQRQVDEAVGSDSIVRPLFEPGDAIFFDELFLHQTATDPAMTRPRYAIENWFFGASQFPQDYAPLAL